MKTHSIRLQHGPPEVPHRIVGERFADMPVRSIEVLMHRRVRLSQWRLRDASASFWRLYWPMSSGASVIHNDNRIPLEVGRLYLMPPHTTFDSETSRVFSKWYVHFTLRGIEQSPSPGVHVVPLTPRMKTLLAKTCPKTVRNHAGRADPLSWQVIELIALMLTHAPSSLWNSPKSDARMDKAMQLLNRDFATKLCLADLSKHTGFSQRALTQRFVAHTGFAPIRYLTELRLDHCCRLLRQTTLSMEAIAEQSGFANRFYLSRMMRKYRHATPAAFRAEARAG